MYEHRRTEIMTPVVYNFTITLPIINHEVGWGGGRRDDPRVAIPFTSTQLTETLCHAVYDAWWLACWYYLNEMYDRSKRYDEVNSKRVQRILLGKIQFHRYSERTHRARCTVAIDGPAAQHEFCPRGGRDHEDNFNEFVHPWAYVHTGRVHHSAPKDTASTPKGSGAKKLTWKSGRLPGLVSGKRRQAFVDSVHLDARN